MKIVNLASLQRGDRLKMFLNNKHIDITLLGNYDGAMSAVMYDDFMKASPKNIDMQMPTHTAIVAGAIPEPMREYAGMLYIDQTGQLSFNGQPVVLYNNATVLETWAAMTNRQMVGWNEVMSGIEMIENLGADKNDLNYVEFKSRPSIVCKTGIIVISAALATGAKFKEEVLYTVEGAPAKLDKPMSKVQAYLNVCSAFYSWLDSELTPKSDEELNDEPADEKADK